MEVNVKQDSQKIILAIAMAVVLIKKRNRSGIKSQESLNADVATKTNNQRKRKNINDQIISILPQLVDTLPLRLTTSSCVYFDLETLTNEMKINQHIDTKTLLVKGSDQNILKSLLVLKLNDVDLNVLSLHIEKRILQKISFTWNDSTEGSSAAASTRSLDNKEFNHDKYYALVITLSKLLYVPMSTSAAATGSSHVSSISADSDAQTVSGDRSSDNVFEIEDTIELNVATADAIHRAILRLCRSMGQNHSNDCVFDILTEDKFQQKLVGEFENVLEYERISDLCILLLTSIQNMKSKILSSFQPCDNQTTASKCTISSKVQNRDVAPANFMSSASTGSGITTTTTTQGKCVYSNKSQEWMGLKSWMARLCAEGVSGTASHPLVCAMYGALVDASESATI